MILWRAWLNIVSEFSQKQALMGRSLHRAALSLSVSNGDPASLAVQPLLQLFCHPGGCIGSVNLGQDLMPHHAAFSFVFRTAGMFIEDTPEYAFSLSVPFPLNSVMFQPPVSPAI